MYKKIRSHPSVYRIYGNKLVNEKSINQELLNQNVKSFKDLLDEQYKSAKDYKPKIEWFEEHGQDINLKEVKIRGV